MHCDAVVALARATSDGKTLFGHKSSWSGGRCPSLCRTSGRPFAPDEKLRTQLLELPQARRTYAVLGSQPDGLWGYEHGVNEHQVAMGCLPLQLSLKCENAGLLGTALTRLALERSRTARQRVDQLTGLVERYGQGIVSNCASDAERDNAFLIAD